MSTRSDALPTASSQLEAAEMGAMTRRTDPDMKLYTIGFTRKSAETFFSQLKASGVRTLIDTRLNNRSQLAGFAKQNDLRYFLREIGQIDYLHLPQLAPTQEILDAFKKKKGTWEAYEISFRALMVSRKIEKAFQPELFESACLLCSEHKPHHCHRRLVAEYLRERWDGIEIEHLQPEDPD